MQWGIPRAVIHQIFTKRFGDQDDGDDGDDGDIYTSWNLKLSFQFDLNGNHFSYTIDLSKVGCHCNAAAHFNRWGHFYGGDGNGDGDGDGGGDSDGGRGGDEEGYGGADGPDATIITKEMMMMNNNNNHDERRFIIVVIHHHRVCSYCFIVSVIVILFFFNKYDNNIQDACTEPWWKW